MIKAIATGYRLLFCNEKGGVVICQGIDDADNQDVMRWYSCLIITVLSIMNMKQST